MDESKLDALMAETKSEEAPKPKPPARKKYIVYGSNIMDDDGNKVGHDQVVALTPATARHYNKLGRLRPYVDEGEENDDDDSDGGGDVGDGAAAKSARTGRIAAKPKG